ncbi:hypothetical protein [Paenibacillus amylolyticus]|uniref:hypothetical protein n=1 Tax=Paenibacillus amylolyticus TaxID=1451 RepID=UPI003EBA5D8D
MKIGKYIITLACLSLVVVIVLTYSFYNEKKMYEQYLMINVKQDMADMRSEIINNEIQFRNILANEKITNEITQDGVQAEQLYNNFTDMMQILDKYNLMNQRFDEQKGLLIKPAKVLTGQLNRNDRLPLILQRMRMTFERLDYINYPVTIDLKARIEEYQQLNNRWLQVIGDPESKEINENEWPEFLNHLERETRAYFEEKKVDFVEDAVWKDSLNPRYREQE